MGYRNEIVKEQFANESARRVLGYDNSGAPTLMGNADMVGYFMRWYLSNINNRFQIESVWTGSNPTASMSGSIGYSDPFLPFTGSLLMIAIIDGIAQDYSEGYGAIIVSKWNRAAVGGAVQVGATQKIFEQKTNVGATSNITNPSNGSIFVSFDSGQLVKLYNWQISAIYSLRKYT